MRAGPAPRRAWRRPSCARCAPGSAAGRSRARRCGRASSRRPARRTRRPDGPTCRSGRRRSAVCGCPRVPATTSTPVALSTSEAIQPVSGSISMRRCSFSSSDSVDGQGPRGRRRRVRRPGPQAVQAVAERGHLGAEDDRAPAHVVGGRGGLADLAHDRRAVGIRRRARRVGCVPYCRSTSARHGPRVRVEDEHRLGADVDRDVDLPRDARCARCAMMRLAIAVASPSWSRASS